MEIPFTKNHWESFFIVAEDIPYARGWERQVDIERNEPLYDASLTLDEYHDWLLANGVRWIAIPDVALDHAGVIEQQLVDGAGSATWLRPVWFNTDWRLFEVTDYSPIVAAPAALIDESADYIVVRTEEAANVTVRYRYTEYLTATGGACVAPDADGWIVATLPRSRGRARHKQNAVRRWEVGGGGRGRGHRGRWPRWRPTSMPATSRRR